MSTSRERIIAHHEAGHAVVARLLGVTVVHASLLIGNAGVLTQSAEVLAHPDDTSGRLRGAEVDAKVSLAGPYAQQKYRPGMNKRRARSAEWKKDLEIAKSSAVKIVLLGADPHQTFDGSRHVTLCREQATEVERLFHRFGVEVMALLDEHWPAVERVAGALLDRRILHGDEVNALVAGSPAMPRSISGSTA
jgi:hypothetical protein